VVAIGQRTWRGGDGLCVRAVVARCRSTVVPVVPLGGVELGL